MLWVHEIFKNYFIDVLQVLYVVLVLAGTEFIFFLVADVFWV